MTILAIIYLTGFVATLLYTMRRRVRHVLGDGEDFTLDDTFTVVGLGIVWPIAVLIVVVMAVGLWMTEREANRKKQEDT